MITPEQASIMMPVLKGILSGNIMESDNERILPFYVDMKGRTVSVSASEVDEDVQLIYVTRLEGTMLKHTGECGEPGTRQIGAELLEADRDSRVVGHIIVAESGGGASNSVPEMADAIRQCSKPVVAFVDGLAASACIYAISYCDYIYAHREMDQVGCIGVMVQLSGLPKYHKDPDSGVIYARVYASESGEKNLDYERALEGDVTVIQSEELDPLCEQFMNDMKANRPGVSDDQLHGKLYFARDCIGSLIDAIGTMEDAAAKVMELAQKKNANNSNMNRYPNLEAMDLFKEQVYDEDGSTVMQACQLEALDAAIANGSQAALDALRKEHAQEIEGLNNAIAVKDKAIEDGRARIAELEAALDAAIARNDGEKPASVKVSADPANSAEGPAPAKTFAEAVEVCRKFLKKNN